jgi:hypothetical protein
MRISGRARTAALLSCLALVLAATPATAALAPVAAAPVQVPGVRGAQAEAVAPAVAVVALPAATTWHPIPSYAYAAHDEPITYHNGCHARIPVVVPRACTFGNPKGTRTVLLFGDSHAAHWHAAVLASAARHGWRVLTLTKSSCPAAMVNVRTYKGAGPYPQCRTWRTAALAALRSHKWGRIDVIITADWHFHQVLSSVTGHLLTGAVRTATWEAGMRHTMQSLVRAAPQVVLLRDSPDLPGDATSARACYARYGLSAGRRCGTTISRALSSAIWGAERRAAATLPHRVTAYDLTTPTCPHAWCGPIAPPYLMFKDDNHWNQTFMRAHFTRLLDAILVPTMAQATA